MEGGSFWLEVRGYEISACKYNFSAIASVWLGLSLFILYASRCRSPMLNGTGECNDTLLYLTLFTIPSLLMAASTIELASASVSTLGLSYRAENICPSLSY